MKLPLSNHTQLTEAKLVCNMTFSHFMLDIFIQAAETYTYQRTRIEFEKVIARILLPSKDRACLGLLVIYFCFGIINLLIHFDCLFFSCGQAIRFGAWSWYIKAMLFSFHSLSFTGLSQLLGVAS
jgi:hypothetical protein